MTWNNLYAQSEGTIFCYLISLIFLCTTVILIRFPTTAIASCCLHYWNLFCLVQPCFGQMSSAEAVCKVQLKSQCISCGSKLWFLEYFRLLVVPACVIDAMKGISFANSLLLHHVKWIGILVLALLWFITLINFGNVYWWQCKIPMNLSYLPWLRYT